MSQFLEVFAVSGVCYGSCSCVFARCSILLFVVEVPANFVETAKRAITCSVPRQTSLECTGKPYLLKAQHSAFNTSDSTTIPLTVQNWQITSFVPDSTDLVVDSSNKCLAVRTVGMQRCPGFHKNVSFAK